jgi:hypothetical protein
MHGRITTLASNLPATILSVPHTSVEVTARHDVKTREAKWFDWIVGDEAVLSHIEILSPRIAENVATDTRVTEFCSIPEERKTLYK